VKVKLLIPGDKSAKSLSSPWEYLKVNNVVLNVFKIF